MKLKKTSLFNTISAVLFIIFLFTALDLPWLFDSLRFYVFQTRDLYRASELLKGQLIFFGPEMTGGGNLPGPLYYFLLASAQFIMPTWESAWVLMLTLAFASAAIGAYYFRIYLNFLPATLLLIALFILSPATLRYLQIFLNVSYVLIFAVIGIICLCLSHTSTDSRIRQRSFIGTGFVLGLSLQLHFSMIFMAMAAVALEILSPQLKLKRHDNKTLIWGLVTFLLPSIPYITWNLSRHLGFEFGQASFYSGTGQNALPSLIHLMNDIKQLNLTTLAQDISLRTLGTVPLPLWAALLIRQKAPYSNIEKVLLVCIVFGFLPFAYWFFADIGIRYSIPFFVPLTFYSALRLDQIMMDQKQSNRFSLYCTVLILFHLLGLLHFLSRDENSRLLFHLLVSLSLVGIISLLLIQPGKTNETRRLTFFIALAAIILQVGMSKAGFYYSNPSILPRLKNSLKVSSLIYKNTGWNIAEAKERIFYLNHHLEQDPSPAYALAQQRIQRIHRILPVPDGFFVAMAGPDSTHADQFNLLAWIKNQKLPSDLRAALDSGHIVLDPPKSIKPLVVGYHVHNEKHIPKHFHNLGQGYIPSQEQRVLDQLPANEATSRTAKEGYIFKWNECPKHHNYCSTGALVHLVRLPQKNLYELRVHIVGAAISQISPWIAPTWTQAWVEPYVEVVCGSKTIRQQLASAIGYQRENSSDPTHLLLRANNSLVAPFKKTFTVECSTAPSEIAVGRTASTVERLYAIDRIAAKELRIQITN